MPVSIAGYKDLLLAAKRISLLLGTLWLLSTNSIAQGFDWEYSARLPHYAGTVYVGPTLTVETMGHTTDLEVLDQVRALQPAFVCVQYNKGTGSGYQVGIRADWWKYSQIAIRGSVVFQSKNAEFMADSPSATLTDGNIFQTQYILSTRFNYVGVEAHCTLRIGESHAWAGVGAEASVLVSQKSSLRERVLQPTGYTFPGTQDQEKLISDKDIAGIRSFMLNPTMSIGYDLDMGRGCYSVPALTLQLPLMGYAGSSSWKVWSVGLQFSLLFSINTY